MRTAEDWNEKYLINSTGWDAKSVTRPIKEYIDQLDDKSIKILIPGAGYGHEAEYIYTKGFSNTFLNEWSEEAIDRFIAKYPNFPKNQIIQGDFFAIEGSFDLIIEQTFFCALDPKLRSNYAEKTSSLLAPKGKLVGVLFDFPLTENGPPFGGDRDSYLSIIEEHYEIILLEKCYNSILPRKNSELFMIAQKTN